VKNQIHGKGGNQGNQVSISAFPIDTILGFRRLAPSGTVILPDTVLRMGNTGNAVKNLQDALKVAGFDCGTSDGDFGKKTEAAVKALQSTRFGLRVDGIFDEATRVYLLEILNQ
jgi:peptidoglycan hydrolase-like protein with peptidoglycan-binding domain